MKHKPKAQNRSTPTLSSSQVCTVSFLHTCTCAHCSQKVLVQLHLSTRPVRKINQACLKAQLLPLNLVVGSQENFIIIIVILQICCIITGAALQGTSLLPLVFLRSVWCGTGISFAFQAIPSAAQPHPYLYLSQLTTVLN